MASPSSAPVALESTHLIQKVAPLGMESPEMELEIAVRLGEVLPFKPPVTPMVTGAVKSSVFASTHVPVVRLVALVLY